MLVPYFQNRDFSERMVKPDVRLRVNSMGWGAIGGCREASITALGGELALWELIELLRCPVTIRDERAEAVWWGMVSEARVRVDAIEVGTTLDSMINATATAYSFVEPGTQNVGARKTTAWVTDADSITEYGRKEFLSSQDGLSDAAATARRDAILAAYKWPAGVAGQFGEPRGRVRYSGAKKSLSATLYCRGWYDTLRWRYANVTGTTDVATTAQIASLVSTYGVFLTATDVEAASGISSSEYRDGDKDVWTEIVGLLESGGASGRRLLATVDVNRRLQIAEEPANTSVSYFLDGHGNLLDQWQNTVDAYRPPVGKWCKLVDVIPGTADVTKLNTPELQFIEGATWSDQGLQLQFRGQPSIEDMFKVRG